MKLGVVCILLLAIVTVAVAAPEKKHEKGLFGLLCSILGSLLEPIFDIIKKLFGGLKSGFTNGKPPENIYIKEHPITTTLAPISQTVCKTHPEQFPSGNVDAILSFLAKGTNCLLSNGNQIVDVKIDRANQKAIVVVDKALSTFKDNDIQSYVHAPYLADFKEFDKLTSSVIQEVANLFNVAISKIQEIPASDPTLTKIRNILKTNLDAMINSIDDGLTKNEQYIYNRVNAAINEYLNGPHASDEVIRSAVSDNEANTAKTDSTVKNAILGDEANIVKSVNKII